MPQTTLQVNYSNGLETGKRQALIRYTRTHSGACIRTVTTPDGLTELSLDMREQERVKAILNGKREAV